MSKYIVYFSKSENSKIIAKKIAEITGYELISFSKPNGKTIDDSQFDQIIKKCKDAEIIIVGTPVIMKQPHPKIRDFVNTVDAKGMAFFVTYENDIGFTLKELKNSAEIRSIRVLGSIEFGGLKSGEILQMSEEDKAAILKKAEKFAQECM